MNKKKILSLIMALVMLVGVFSPLTALAAETEKVTNTVTLHKILMDKDTFNAFTKGTKGKDGTDYVGKEIANVKDFFAGKNAKEGTAKEIAGVYFAWQVKGKEFVYKTDSEGILVDKDNQVIEANIKDYDKLTTDESKAKAVVDHEQYIKGKLVKGVMTPDLDSNGAIQFTNDLKEAFGAETEKTGVKFDTSKLKGTFLIKEIHEKSSYKGEKGETLTDMKAVPVEITLPLVNDNGVVEEAHVYPKNTEEKPQIDKNFAKDNTLTEADGNFDQYYTEEEKTAGDQTGDIKVGPKFDNNDKKKKIAEAEVGKNIPYEVETEIPAKSKLKLAKWDDNMSAGLTYNKDLKVTIGNKEITNTQETKYYSIKETDSGFVLTLEEAGLALINDKAEATTVTLKYSATVNSDAIADIPDTNDVKFKYGNNPSKETEPKSTTPNNGKITVVKTWGGEDSEWADGEYAKFKLVNATTGREVTVDDLVYTGSETDETAKKEFEAYKKSFDAIVELKKGEKATHTWKYLDSNQEYTAIEIESQTLSDAEYTEASDGTIKVTNHKSNNPKPLNPTEPKVVTGGKRFVKTDQDGNRLAGAEFYVKNSEGKYLVAKTIKEQQEADIDLKDKKEALDAAVKAYNDLSADDQKGDKGTKAKTAINDAQDAYNKAFKAAAQSYKWEDKKDNALVLVSDGEGRFEITGLAYGDYKLEEKTPPEGFAKLNGDIDFKVAKGSYTDAAGYEEGKTAPTHIEYNKGDNTVKGQEVVNKKVSIPQTGGMGTVLFTIVGISLMAGAVVAMKRNREEA